MSKNVRVLSFELVDAAPRADGSMMVGSFDAELPGVLFMGCILIRMANGTLRAYPPEARSRRFNGTAIKITDNAVQAEMQRRAIAAYSAIIDL